MKKLLLCIVMLFSITMNSHELHENLSGVWSSNETSYYVVILYNEDEGYKFVNFSFYEQDTVEEQVVEATDNYVKTRLVNPDNEWEVFITYTYEDNTLTCKFEGDSNHSTIYKKNWIVTN
tara:strand:+ start:170 stop:529 length:360 start_codon:yes stop_codon:yes gene_type:complete